MNVKYIFEDQILYESANQSAVPSVGHMVYLEEIFFVKNVVWYPDTQITNVYLSEMPPTTAKVAQVRESNVNLAEVKQVRAVADKALKESTKLKREVFSIRKHINTELRNKTKNDT